MSVFSTSTAGRRRRPRGEQPRSQALLAAYVADEGVRCVATCCDCGGTIDEQTRTDADADQVELDGGAALYEACGWFDRYLVCGDCGRVYRFSAAGRLS